MPTGPCPSCGADLKVKRGEDHVACDICGAAYKIKRADGRVRLQRIETFTDVPSTLDLDSPVDAYDPAQTGSGQTVTRGPGLSDRYFLVNTKNADYVNGKTDRLGQRPVYLSCATIFLIPFLLAGLCIITVTIRQWVDWFRLSTDGQITQGYYDERWVSSGDEIDSYYTSYTFTVNGVTYRGMIDSRTSYNNFAAGAPVEVRYWQANPNSSVLVDYFYRPSLFLAGFTVCWNGLLGLFVLIIFGGAARRSKINRAGDKALVEGRVIKAGGRTVTDENHVKKFQLTVEVTFRSPKTGKTITAHASHTYNTYNGVAPMTPPRKGASALVLYIDDNLHEIM